MFLEETHLDYFSRVKAAPHFSWQPFWHYEGSGLADARPPCRGATLSPTLAKSELSEPCCLDMCECLPHVLCFERALPSSKGFLQAFVLGLR